jgi:hypothetical protein
MFWCCELFLRLFFFIVQITQAAHQVGAFVGLDLAHAIVINTILQVRINIYSNTIMNV